MIVVSRTGELLHADPLTEEQKKAAALAVFDAFLRMNPEMIREAVEECLREDN